MKKILLTTAFVLLLMLSFIPFFAKPLSEGGEIQINFWQKYLMKID